MVDANLSFVVIDVGFYGRESDLSVFKEYPFGKKLYSSQLNMPEPAYLSNTQNVVQL